MLQPQFGNFLNSVLVGDDDGGLGSNPFRHWVNTIGQLLTGSVASGARVRQ